MPSLEGGSACVPAEQAHLPGGRSRRAAWHTTVEVIDLKSNFLVLFLIIVIRVNIYRALTVS